MCSEVSPPRLSFSNDLLPARVSAIQNGDSHRESLSPPSDSSSEFEFAINSVSEVESSSADELFCNGVLLPLSDTQKLHQLPPLPPEISQREIPLSEFDQKQSKPTWGFKRSSSLNCDSKKASLWPLPILSRSNSTGSEPNSKQTPLKKQPSSGGRSNQPNQKTHLRKNNNVWIYPVLNLPPSYICKGAANIFGLGSLLGSGKDKKSRK